MSKPQTLAKENEEKKLAAQLLDAQNAQAAQQFITEEQNKARLQSQSFDKQKAKAAAEHLAELRSLSAAEASKVITKSSASSPILASSTGVNAKVSERIQAALETAAVNAYAKDEKLQSQMTEGEAVSAAGRISKKVTAALKKHAPGSSVASDAPGAKPDQQATKPPTHANTKPSKQEVVTQVLMEKLPGEKGPGLENKARQLAQQSASLSSNVYNEVNNQYAEDNSTDPKSRHDKALWYSAFFNEEARIMIELECLCKTLETLVAMSTQGKDVSFWGQSTQKFVGTALVRFGELNGLSTEQVESYLIARRPAPGKVSKDLEDKPSYSY